MKNMFIVLEGTHCAGKSTVAKILQNQYGFFYTHTPASSYDVVREYMHSTATGMSRFLFYMAGNIDASAEIKIALKNQSVVCDRYVASTKVGTHVDFGISMNKLDELTVAIGNEYLLEPDYSFFLYTKEAERRKRLANRPPDEPFYKTNYDLARINKIDQTHFEMIFNNNACCAIDTTKISPDEVAQFIINFINK